jgi:peptidoglycan/LPS O-acetylase OafA/YrhL
MPEPMIAPGAEATAPPVPLVGPEPRVYFPELDGLRFVAFALVFLFHGGIPGPILTSLIGPILSHGLQRNGWVGVQLFFILSGFLIAGLLLREENRFGRIDLRAFWVRRILRIWPLYYLIVGLTFFLIPWLEGTFGTTNYHNLLRRHLAMFLAFLGNWSMAWRGPAGGDEVTILWSVCVEEQFYLICPVLLVIVPKRWRVPVVAGLITLAIGERYRLARSGVDNLAFQYNSFVQADTLLAGVLLALVLHRHPPGRGFVRALGVLQWLVLGGFGWLLIQPNLAHGSVLRRTWDFVALWACGVGLVAVASLRPGWLRGALAYPRLVWLGKISYGLYMYHEIALRIGKRLDRASGWFPNKEAILAIVGFALTVGLAAVSYYGYERPFLKLKRRWTRVPSRPV